MGPYCRYCDRRCFVLRVLRNGKETLMATCADGAAHDREVTGEDHATARNPRAPVPGGCPAGRSCAGAAFPGHPAHPTDGS